MSYFRFSVGLWGRLDSNQWTPKRTDLQSVAIATMRLPLGFCSQLVGTRADEGTRTPDRLITNQLLYQLSYIGFFSLSNNSLSRELRLQRYYFFPNTPKFFSTFLQYFSQTIDSHTYPKKKKIQISPLYPPAKPLPKTPIHQNSAPIHSKKTPYRNISLILNTLIQIHPTPHINLITHNQPFATTNQKRPIDGVK